MATPEDILNGGELVGSSKPPTNDLESKRESLSTKEYTGVDMDFSDTIKLSDKDVEKYYKRYQVVSGKKIADGLVDSSFQLIAQVVGKFVRIDGQDALVSDWKNDLRDIWVTCTERWKTHSITISSYSHCKALQTKRT